MTGKENYLNALLQKTTEWIPVEGENLIYAGFEGNEMEKGPAGGGKDGFGVTWAAPESGAGTAIPEPGNFLLDEETICDWKSIIQFPDVASYHWEADAKEQLKGIDRTEMAVDYGDGNGPFERLAAFMGFENALVAMAMEPEAVEELLTAITDYKLEALDYIAKYYQPDTYTLYDDVATQICTFMSPEAYRRMIAPQHKRIAARAKELGMIPVIHCCGHAEALVESFIEEGFAAWTSVQPCNDIKAILEKYGDQICICGGYDTNGQPGTTDEDAVLQKEIERCYETYGACHGYIFAGFILLAVEDGMAPEEAFAVPSGKLCEMAMAYMHKKAEK